MNVNYFSFPPGAATTQPGTRAPMLQQILETRVRIIFIAGYPGDVRDILLTAKDLGMYGPGWVCNLVL